MRSAILVKTGTFQQFIRGGIQFATPPTVPLAPQANPDKHFFHRLKRAVWLPVGIRLARRRDRRAPVAPLFRRLFIRGGIQFATPPTVPLAPQANPDKHFLLQDEPPKECHRE
jgi:paraquat-inducible protein B